MKDGIFRLRLGIALFVISWLPFAQVVLMIAHDNGKLLSEADSTRCRLIIWTIQVLIGFVAIWLAGTVAISMAKQGGWKQAPKRLWHLFWYGSSERT